MNNAHTMDVEIAALKPSPFHFEHEWTVKKENQNKNCTHLQIETMIAKNLLNAIDLEIVYLLTQYRYVNTNNITYYLNNLSNLKPVYMKTEYTRNLRKLYRAGILIRYCCYRVDASDPEEKESPASHLRFYDLSPGTYSYMQGIVKDPYFLFSISDVAKIELLAANQLLFRFCKHYSGMIEQTSYCRKLSGTGEDFILHGSLLMKTERSEYTFPPLCIHLLSYRDCSPITTATVRKIKKIHQLFLQTQKDRQVSLLIIAVENISFIYQLYLFLQENDIKDLIPIYFSIDTQYDAPPLENLYLCQSQDDKHYIKKIAMNLK